MSHRVVAFGTALIVVAIAFGGYRWWGASMEARYERYVQALRDSGEFVDEPPAREEIPPDQNAAGPLGKAAKLFARLVEDTEFGYLLAECMLGVDYFQDFWDREQLEKVWPRLNDYFALLEAADQKPVFLPRPVVESLDDNPIGEVQDVCDLLQFRAWFRPESTVPTILYLFRLSDKWIPTAYIERLIRISVRIRALEILHRALRTGNVDTDALRAHWDVTPVADAVVSDLREILRGERSDFIRGCEKFRAGDDPFREFREIHYRLPKPLTWHDRPYRHRAWLEPLEKLANGIRCATSEDALRRTLADGRLRARIHPSGLHRMRFALGHLASLRLAQIAVAIRSDAAREGRARDHLEDYAPSLSGRIPSNPFTGQPFSYERHHDMAVLSCPLVPEGARHRSLREYLERNFDSELLRWEIRWAPAKAKD
ncbi:MAG: hypothetical protein V3T86_11860 [Planctomycetota bacterium]